MTSDDLYSLFRSDVVDAVAPYLWSDIEVWNYMNDAYRMFVRNTGGIPDTTSSVTQVALVAGAATSKVSPLILKFMSAYLLSDGSELKVINEAQMPRTQAMDYGNAPVSFRDTSTGRVSYMVTGVGRTKDNGVVRWLRVPAANDTAQLSVMRLPLDTVTTGFEFDEVGEEHHEAFMLHMKARAYGKQDAETFNRGRRDDYAQQFRAYCADAKSEFDRYKSNTRGVAYGGI
jgi:hypothetical protein